MPTSSYPINPQFITQTNRPLSITICIDEVAYNCATAVRDNT